MSELDKKYVIGAVIIILLAIVVAGVICYFGLESPEPTAIELVSSNSLYDGDEFSVKLVSNETPVANESIEISFVDNNGAKTTENITTNNEGIAKLVLNNMSPGNYSVECNYAGNSEYEGTSLTVSLNVLEKVVEKETQSSKSSKSSGYGDYDTTEFTGEYDSEGKPIYRSVHSQSNYGGQYMAPGVYEEYWSENGPIYGGKLR